jgi:hypothetical protein
MMTISPGVFSQEPTELGVELLDASPRSATFRVQLPDKPPLVEQETPAGRYLRWLPGGAAGHQRLGGPEHVSKPEIPVVGALLALPLDGKVAAVSVEPEGPIQAIKLAWPLYPVQPEERTSSRYPDRSDWSFDKDRYQAGTTRLGGQVEQPLRLYQGDAHVERLSLAAVGYDPAAQVLSYANSYRVTVRFAGGECFRHDYLLLDSNSGRKPFFDPVERALESDPIPQALGALNWPVVRGFACEPPLITPRLLGARLLIVTPPEFLPAAGRLRNHKVSLGISTQIISTATIATWSGIPGSPVSAEEIRDYLQHYHNHAVIRPKWVDLMGDAEWIPTHYGNNNTWDSARNAGDIYYGQFGGGAASLPAFGIARMPVDTLEQAETVVDKVIAYETSPPTDFLFGDDYYSRLTFACQFQDNEPDDRANRWFAETCESIRDHILTKGYTPQRIYSAPAASNPTYWNDGSVIPPELQRPGFAWDGDSGDIIDAANLGTSILFHRDHGWWNGWGTPSFGTGSLASVAVSDNEYPMVFSVNCASGIFDNETVDDPANIVGGGYGPNPASTYWAETFVRQSDGALAVIGDTRSSSTTLNNALAKGLFDAVFPDYQSYGGASAITKVADVLTHAKGYVAASGFSAAATEQELKIYNVLGEGTVDIKVKAPWKLDITRIVAEKLWRWVQVRPRPVCLSCPPEVWNGRTVVVAMDPERNQVLGRGIADARGVARLEVGDYQGKVVYVASSAGGIPDRVAR